MSCVIEQQIHYRSTKGIFQNMLTKAQLKDLTLENFSIFEEKGLKDGNLSPRKCNTILNLVHFFQCNQPSWENMREDEIRSTLREIDGIGTWTIDMILIYTLGMPNIFSANDYHINIAMNRLYGNRRTKLTKGQILDISSYWSPFKTTAFLALLNWKKQSFQLNPFHNEFVPK